LSALARLKWLVAGAGLAVLAFPAFALVVPLASVATDRSSPVTDAVPSTRPASAETTNAVSAPAGLSLDAAVRNEIERSGGVALSDGGSCPAGSLRLSYEHPGDGWSAGAFVDPLGPEPNASTTSVNGVVLCDGSHYAFVGFEASLVDGAWSVGVVPDPAGGFGSEAAEDRANMPDTAAAPIPIDPTMPIVGLLNSASIEGYASYEPQTTCDSTPKPGTLALRNLLLARYPSTGSSGISRGCNVGGRSEHKEGRAFDWRASVNNATQRAAVDDFLAALFATDSYGHAHALARRMGVMYVIWNRQIWSAYSASSGWRPYNGSSPHTDHVHISLSWAGARAQTSFWSGTVVPGLPEKPGGGGAGGAAGGQRRAPVAGAPAPNTDAPHDIHHHRRTLPAPTSAADPATTGRNEQPADTSDPRTDWRRRHTPVTVPSTSTTTELPSSTTTTPTTTVRRWQTTTTTSTVPRSTTTTSTSTVPLTTTTTTVRRSRRTTTTTVPQTSTTTTSTPSPSTSSTSSTTAPA
jgi:hypothetical protein